MSKAIRSRLFLVIPSMLAFFPAGQVANAQERELAHNPPPFELLVDLAGILGEAHAIRSLCNGDGDQTWRAYMMEMMSIESPSSAQRSSLTSAFNRGYRAQSRQSRTCNTDIVATEAELANRGRMLADTIARIYLE